MKEYNNGFALVFTMILLIVVPAIGAAITHYSLNSIHLTDMNDKSTQAYYLARSGAEAVIAAWKEQDVANKPTGDIEAVIYDGNSFILKSEYESNPSAYEDKIAEISVNIQENEDNSTSFISTAELQEYSETVTATVSAYKSGHDEDLDWYDYNTGEIKPGPNTETVTVSESFWEWLYGILDADYIPESVDIKYHDEVYGTVELETDGSPLSLKDNDQENKVAFIANSLFIRNELNLKEYDGRKGALITIAETITFDEGIQINKRASSYGSLILSIPENNGVKLDGYDGLYGKVYFKGPVVLSELQFWWIIPYISEETIISSGESYYFKNIVDDEGNQEGLDLIRWADNGYEEDVMIEILDSDKKNASPPVPEEEYIIIWN